MKLAEALILKADMKKKLHNLKSRIGNNTVIQEGSAPAEDPRQLINEANGVIKELQSVSLSITATNQQTQLADGRSLNELINKREALTQQHALIQAAINSTQREPDRYSMREIKWIPVIEISSLQKQADDISMKMRQINIAIQECNWQTELL